MRGCKRAYVAAALAAVLLVVPISLAAATGDDARGHGQHHKRFSALIFSKTAAFRHTECIPQGTVAIAQMAARRGFEVDATENAAAFTDENLANYDVVIFLCTTGDVLDAPQQSAFERYIRAGGGYAGIHSASDTEYDWAWYGGLVGAYFRDHPGAVNPQFQVATMDVEDRHTAATRRLGRTWTREEEWYNFRTNPRDTVHVLLWSTRARTTRAATACRAGPRAWAITRSPGANRMTAAVPFTPRWGTRAITGRSRCCCRTCSAASKWPQARPGSTAATQTTDRASRADPVTGPRGRRSKRLPQARPRRSAVPRSGA